MGTTRINSDLENLGAIRRIALQMSDSANRFTG